MQTFVARVPKTIHAQLAIRAKAEGVSLNALVLAFIFAVPLALITYFFGNYWDDKAFDPRYTEDPPRGFRGKWLNTSRRNCFGLLPAGRDLDQARKQAVAVLQLPSVEGVYAAARDELRRTKEWAPANRLLILSKLCRSLIWPSFLVATGLMAQATYGFFTGGGGATAPTVLGALVAVGFGLFLFVPYVNLRVEHMLEMYRSIASRKAPPNKTLQPSSRT